MYRTDDKKNNRVEKSNINITTKKSNSGIQLYKVMNELKISLDIAINFLREKGFEVDARSTIIITEHQKNLLYSAFKTNKSNAKETSNKLPPKKTNKKKEVRKRLSSALKECNISLERAVKFLRDSGYLVDERPNTLISQTAHNLLIAEFKNKKALKSKEKSANKITKEEYENKFYRKLDDYDSNYNY